jgi:hypothetical protein
MMLTGSASSTYSKGKVLIFRYSMREPMFFVGALEDLNGKKKGAEHNTPPLAVLVIELPPKSWVAAQEPI